jgi:hypothetical protein
MNIKGKAIRSSRLLLALAVAWCGAAACVSGLDDATETTVAPLRALAAEEAELLRLLNAYRSQNGLSTLVATPLLNQVAYDHSLDMATHGYFSHASLDGRSPFDRMEAAGYRGGYMAENIAAGYADAASTFEQWRTSAGHDANMRGAHYRAIGIGRAYVAGSPYRYYWTTDFGDVVDASALADAGTVADAGVVRDGGASPDAGPPADAGVGDGGTKTCVGTNEVEPNGSSSSPNALGARAWGRLASGTDQDWFTFSLAVRGPYDLRLTPTSDARVAVWQRVAGVYYAVSQASYTRVAKTSSGAGKYLVRVKSPTGRLQSYGLTLAK